MKRGQILGRQFIIIGSWIVLLIAVALAFALQSFSGSDNAESLTAMKTGDAHVVLSTYLRQTVDLNGHQVPMAEALISYVLAKDEVSFDKSADAFFAKMADGRLRYLEITVQDGTKWSQGSQQGAFVAEATTKLPLPDGMTITVKYLELEPIQTRLIR